MKISKIANQSGDTIVEVLISIAVVGLALAGGYALSNHSLRTGIDSAQRNAAVLAADGQVEFLKNAVASNNTAQYTINPGTPFCINFNNGNREENAANCRNLFGYDMAITYSGTTKVFTIIPDWSIIRNNQESRAMLYYKLPDSFTPQL